MEVTILFSFLDKIRFSRSHCGDISLLGIISLLAVVQILGCLTFSRIAGVRMHPSEPHYWISAFNHFMSVSILAVVFFAWLRPLQQDIGAVSKKLDASRRKNAEIGEVLRGHIGWQFESWGLTSAERDVATLSLKGLKISEIAEYRGSREGTVKAHLNSIFTKAGVSSRTELLATCLDSFIDLGCTATSPYPATARDRTVIRNAVALQPELNAST
ncbi:MAG: helix-turn-helix transcriptional regulator [Pseudomonadota bacterium]